MLSSMSAGRSAFRMSRQLRWQVSPIRLHGVDALIVGGAGAAIAIGSRSYALCIFIFGVIFGWRVLIVRHHRKEEIAEASEAAKRWRTGAKAERRTARSLWWGFTWRQILTLGFTRFIVLHDRRVPGSKANVDTIVISRSGVTNVDSKSRQGHWNDEGGHLTYNGRNIDVTTTEWESKSLTQVLDKKFGKGVIPVSTIWAVHSRGELPFIVRMFGGVRLMSSRLVPSTIARQPKQLSRSEVREVAEFVAKKFVKA